LANTNSSKAFDIAWRIIMQSNIKDSKSTPQTFVMKEYIPGEKGLYEAINAESTVRIQVIQGPIRRRPTVEYMLLEDGNRRITDPMTESKPISDVKWDLYINLVDGWTQLSGQSRIPWKDDAEHQVLEAMLKNYPHNIDRFDASDAIGKMKVTDGRFRSMLSGVRKLVGPEVLPDRYRALSQVANIVIERRG
jgi:hypothetical protein